jgi:hypothetical protein
MIKINRLNHCDKCHKSKNTEVYGFYIVTFSVGENASAAGESASKKYTPGQEMKIQNICASCVKSVAFRRYAGLTASFIFLIPAITLIFSIYSPLVYLKMTEWFYFITVTIFLVIFTCLYYIYLFLTAEKRNIQVIGDDLAKEIYIKTHKFQKLKNFKVLNRKEYAEFIKAV